MDKICGYRAEEMRIKIKFKSFSVVRAFDFQYCVCFGIWNSVCASEMAQNTIELIILLLKWNPFLHIYLPKLPTQSSFFQLLLLSFLYLPRRIVNAFRWNLLRQKAREYLNFYKYIYFNFPTIVRSQ